MTVNHGVLGSSPCSGAFREFSSAGSEHLPYKQRVGGSNPSTPTKQKQPKRLLFCFGEYSPNYITTEQRMLIFQHLFFVLHSPFNVGIDAKKIAASKLPAAMTYITLRQISLPQNLLWLYAANICCICAHISILIRNSRTIFRICL